MTLDEAWIKVGEACYAHEDHSARHALMLIRADMGEKSRVIWVGMMKHEPMDHEALNRASYELAKKYWDKMPEEDS